MMASLEHANALFRPASTADLIRSGFTEAQAAAITQAVHAASSEAVDTLGKTLAKWHAYLALYLLTQIGIAILVILMVRTTGIPLPPPWVRPASHTVPLTARDVAASFGARVDSIQGGGMLREAHAGAWRAP
ncbi:hypothetical protein ABC766_16215 [Methylobacterium fujisawaense]|jgi:hypothetical protein|uniref:hypothetical protein n=1 Tax=Methylobacterium fujisawaense TaxID=107400 RepID=UPI0031F50F61